MIEIRLPLSPALQREIALSQAMAQAPARSLDLGLRFPRRCIYCGRTSDAFLPGALPIEGVSASYDIPYCTRHLAQAQRINATINHPRRMVYLLTALYVLAVPVFFRFNPNADLLAVVMLGAFGLVLGFWLLTALIIRPLVGLFLRAVRDTPAGGTLGFGVRYLPKERLLAVRLTHPEYARLFAQANHP
ncbi:MAG: hypothetical protein GX605_02800 [Chloroflexi bacterium]|nr:hypothetical protein [Chloroflexota bacterium]